MAQREGGHRPGGVEGVWLKRQSRNAGVIRVGQGGGPGASGHSQSFPWSWKEKKVASEFVLATLYDCRAAGPT